LTQKTKYNVVIAFKNN